MCLGLLRDAEVLHVVDRLLEQRADVRVVERVDELAAVALPRDPAEVAQQAELM
jgi:hypothetical protein